MDRYFLDSEFIDDGKTIDLISIGIVCDDGRELYLQSTEFDLQHTGKWVKENVLPHLILCPNVSSHGDSVAESVDANKFEHPYGQCTFIDHIEGTPGVYSDCFWRTRDQMRDEVQAFFNPSDGFELWGWCAGYDWVAFCQLFGTMMDLPQGWPHYIRDLQQVLDGGGIEDEDLPQQEEGLHNALSDAKHIKRLWEFVNGK